MSKPSTEQTPENTLPPRLARELKTVLAMIRIYCQARHQTAGLCGDCQELSDYAKRRLNRCPFQENKPTCGACTVHCYKPEMRARIVAVMRFSGPKMIFHHPFLAVAHLLDEK